MFFVLDRIRKNDNDTKDVHKMYGDYDACEIFQIVLPRKSTGCPSLSTLDHE